MNSQSAEGFYNKLSNYYHMISIGWDQAVQNQGQSLKRLIRGRLNPKYLTVLDCSCGIGTQSIGLAMNGFSVSGSDISASEIERAGSEATRLGAQVDFRVADFYKLSAHFSQKFDVVLSFDNALAHIHEENELTTVLKEMGSVLSIDGALLLSIREYEKILKERPTGTVPQTFQDENGKRVVFQTWNWKEVENIYEMTLFIQSENADGGWSNQMVATTHMRAWTQKELINAARVAGFNDLQWLSANFG